MVAEILTSSLLSRAGFAHGFTTRRGGVSPAPFDSLNLGASPAGSEPSDARENVGENLLRVATEVGFDPHLLYLVDQVHGARVLLAEGEGPARGRQEADAIVLRDARVGAVKVADCVPVLVGDMISGDAAVIHAGWRGVVAGVVGAALASLGDSRNLRVAAIGPCIGPCCFEVGLDVAERLAGVATDPAVVVRRTDAKAFVDLRRAVRAQLRSCGIGDGDVEDVGGCTKCDGGTYFSFRRDGARSGRHIAVIRAKAASS